MSRHLQLTRRDVFKLAGLGATTLYLGGCASVFRKSDAVGAPDFLKAYGPIDRLLFDKPSLAYTGDRPHRAHEILWGGSVPESSSKEKTKVVIVGGGMSGIFCAYLLRDLNPILLEQADRFGGNSRGESWKGIDYSIGAAYFCEPSEDSPLKASFDALKLREICKVKSGDDPFVLKGKLDPSSWASNRKLHEYLKQVFASSFPEIPAITSEHRQRLDELDAMTFHELIAKKVGKLSPHLDAAIEYYLWSSLNAGAKEVSAAVALNFMAAEMGNLWVAPGGNAGVAERILEELLSTISETNLRSRSLVHSVENTAKGATVKYLDADGKNREINADVVVMACPKFVCSRILKNAPEDQLAAWKSVEYRSYLVANVLVDKKMGRDFYDLLLLGDGKADFSDLKKASEQRQVTDVILGTFAKTEESSATVLTLYRPLPYSGARIGLLNDASFETAKKEFMAQIMREILPLPLFSSIKVHDVRVARWGHPLPVATKGFFKAGVVDKLRRPFERVFFCEQDNWVTPALETGATEAMLFEKEIRKKISS